MAALLQGKSELRSESTIKRAQNVVYMCISHFVVCAVRIINFSNMHRGKQLVDDYFAALMIELVEKAKQPWTQATRFSKRFTLSSGTPTDLSAKAN